MVVAKKAASKKVGKQSVKLTETQSNSKAKTRTKTTKAATPKNSTSKAARKPKVMPQRAVAAQNAVKAQLSILDDEFEQLTLIKERLAALGQPIKRGEILRAGIHQLTKMTDTRLQNSISMVPIIASK